MPEQDQNEIDQIGRALLEESERIRLELVWESMKEQAGHDVVRSVLVCESRRP